MGVSAIDCWDDDVCIAILWKLWAGWFKQLTAGMMMFAWAIFEILGWSQQLTAGMMMMMMMMMMIR